MVDDEIELVRSTVKMLNREFKNLRVRGSEDSREVAGWLAHERPAVLITDVRMPNVSGLELVTLAHQRWGPVPVVVITAFPTAEVDSAARAGRFAYLAKPFSFGALKDTVLRVYSRPAPSAFRGAIAVTTLAEVVQLYGLACHSGALVIESHDRSAEILFDSGNVVDATCGALSGVAAFNDVLAWSAGNFRWEDRRAARTTIRGSLSALLIEAYRLVDEASRPSPETQSDVGDALAGLFAPESPTVSAEPADLSGNNVLELLARLQRADGFLGAALIDSDTGLCLGQLGRDGPLALDGLGSSNAEFVRTERQAVDRLALADEVEDILITLGQEYQIIRLVKRSPSLFLYLVLDRSQANLALARYVLTDAEKDLVL